MGEKKGRRGPGDASSCPKFTEIQDIKMGKFLEFLKNIRPVVSNIPAEKPAPQHTEMSPEDRPVNHIVFCDFAFLIHRSLRQQPYQSAYNDLNHFYIPSF